MADEKKGWSERQTGTTEENKVVTFREGTGANKGQTIIGAGELSNRGLSRSHDHFGPDSNKESDHGNLAHAPDADDYTKSDYQPNGDQK